jgi:hypothetical protein
MLGQGPRLPMVRPLEELFPGLAANAYQVTSPRDNDYNCIAWAAGDTRRWWWPSQSVGKEYWPPGVPRERTQAAFVAAFATVGYTVCEGDEPEAGFEKVALFADAQARPTHAARQLPNGSWTSKLGKAEDIEHRLRDVEGLLYGVVVLVMRRPVPPMAREAKGPRNAESGKFIHY